VVEYRWSIGPPTPRWLDLAGWHGKHVRAIEQLDRALWKAGFTRTVYTKDA
jgi:hypothetical protein